MAETQANQSTALVVPEQQLIIAKQIDGVIQFVAENSKGAGSFQRAIVKSVAMEKISQLMSDETIKGMVKNLMSKKLGFKSDKPDYKIDVVKDCVIEAILTGLEVVGNHFNIIGGNMYVTKEGFTHLLAKIPGLWHNITYSLPKKDGTTTVVKCVIKWKLPNMLETKSFEIEFPVNVNDGMKTDAILGKAERKAKKWLYYELTGNDISEGDIVDGEITIVSETTNNKVEGEVIDENVEMLSEDENRAVEFLKKSKTKEDLDKRWNEIQKQFPNLSDKYYKERLTSHTQQ